MSDRSTPRHDIAIIGAGPGGLAAAHRARQLGRSVVLFEADAVGGTSVNRGCVAKRMLVTASRQGDAIRCAQPFGWSVPGQARFDWPGLRERVAEQVRAVSQARMQALQDEGVTVVRRRVKLAGDGRIVTLEADGEAPHTWSATDIVLATGSRPLVPELPGMELALLSHDLFTLPALPERLAMIGGGYIAVEFAGALQRLGVQVTVFEAGERLLEGFDADVVSRLQETMRRAGIEIVCGAKVAGIVRSGAGLALRFDGALDGTNGRGGFDAVALVIGRSPNVEGIGLETAGVTLSESGRVAVDRLGRTDAAHVHAIGDVCESIQLAPVAAEGGRAVIDAIAGRHVERTLPHHVPTAIYSTPECGSVGLTESEAQAQGIAHRLRQVSLRPFDQVSAAEPDEVLIKLVVQADTERLLGFHSIGSHAVESTQLMALPIAAGLSAQDLRRTMPLHPTQAEAIVELARAAT